MTDCKTTNENLSSVANLVLAVITAKLTFERLVKNKTAVSTLTSSFC